MVLAIVPVASKLEVLVCQSFEAVGIQKADGLPDQQEFIGRMDQITKNASVPVQTDFFGFLHMQRPQNVNFERLHQLPNKQD